MVNDYFDQIYLLNLKKRKSRLIDSKNRLDSIGIKYTVFNGTDGSVLNEIWKEFNNEFFTNPNYLGCAISHLSIYQDAIENNHQRILILEDDNLVNKNILDIFTKLNIPDWNDIFYLGYIPLNNDCTMWDYKFGINDNNKISNNIFNPKNLWGLFAYGITFNLMKELVDLYNASFPMEIDRYFVNIIQPRNKSIAISPQLFCCKDDVHSDNLGFIPTNMKQKSIDTRFVSADDYI